MVAPGTSTTPPVMTRPGSPSAWASTAVIILEKRMTTLTPALRATPLPLRRRGVRTTTAQTRRGRFANRPYSVPVLLAASG